MILVSKASVSEVKNGCFCLCITKLLIGGNGKKINFLTVLLLGMYDAC